MTLPPSTAEALSIDTVEVGHVVVIRLRGRLNWASARGLLEDLETRWTASGAVIDLSGVDFIDAAGTGLIVRLGTGAAQRSATLAVVATEPIASVLRHVGLADIVPCRSSEAEAIAAVRRELDESAQPAR